MLRRLYAGDHDFDTALDRFLNRTEGADPQVMQAAQEILADVCARGDAAVCEYTQRFDRIPLTPETMRVPAETIAGAEVEAEVMQALELAAERIRAYHEHMLPENIDYKDENGVRLGARWTPMEAVGLYVPGGTATYPSTVLMNAIPAKVAGVKRLVMVVPTPDGVLKPVVLAAAKLAGVDEIYTIGGAQAIGALAYGTEIIAPVDKIVGPGNAYVAEAKRQVFGLVGIDMIAGPSEILVVADQDNDPAWVAADLLSQAEHDLRASSVLITDDAIWADAVEAAMEAHLQTLPRAEMARQSLADYGAIILVEDVMRDAAAIVDRLAPEHLQLAVSKPDALMQQIHHAGAIFLGRYTPEALGDYVLGPSHVLPTSGTARFSSGLSVMDFMKRSSFMEVPEAAYSSLGKASHIIAQEEGLQAHGLSANLRLKGKA